MRGDRGDRAGRGALRPRPGVRQQGRAADRARLPRTRQGITSSATATRTRNSSTSRCSRCASGSNASSCWKPRPSCRSSGSEPPPRRAPDAGHPRQARRQGRGPLERIERGPQHLRPDDGADRRAGRCAARARATRLPAAAALPPRVRRSRTSATSAAGCRGLPVLRGAQAGGAAMGYLDLGGGLGVDYDGSQTNSNYSKNYSLDEYSSDVIETIMTALAGDHVLCAPRCSSPESEPPRDGILFLDPAVQHPRCDELQRPGDAAPVVPAEEHELVKDLHGIERRERQDRQGVLQRRDLLPPEIRDPVPPRTDPAAFAFPRGEHIPAHRVGASSSPGAAEGPSACRPGFDDLEESLADIYYGNFSVFQSLPDVWAIEQVFPDHPGAPAYRAAHAPRHSRRHHLRLRRQDRPLHRVGRPAAHAARAFVRRKPAVLLRRLPWWAPTRNPLATCTTSWATPMSRACASATTAASSSRAR